MRYITTVGMVNGVALEALIPRLQAPYSRLRTMEEQETLDTRITVLYKAWSNCQFFARSCNVMASLRVGVITFDWYPYEPRALRLAEAAANAGYEVDVICLRQPHEKGYAVH